MEQKQQNTTSHFQLPTELIDLPSKGLLYPKESPLSSGTVEMKYMTAKEEDILTNQSYLEKGIAIDKLLQSLIVTPMDYDSLLIGDKNAILIASRVLGYGKDYSFEYEGKPYTVDLSQIQHSEIDYTLLESGKNEFEFKLPLSGTTVTFRLLTGKEEKEIEDTLKSFKRVYKDAAPELSTRVKHMILSVNGNYERKAVNDFVDNFLLAADSRAFRSYVKSIQPDVDLRFYPDGGPEGGVSIPMGVSFFWPDA